MKNTTCIIIGIDYPDVILRDYAGLRMGEVCNMPFASSLWKLISAATDSSCLKAIRL
jgi:hypothetical protein